MLMTHMTSLFAMFCHSFRLVIENIHDRRR